MGMQIETMNNANTLAKEPHFYEIKRNCFFTATPSARIRTAEGKLFYKWKNKSATDF